MRVGIYAPYLWGGQICNRTVHNGGGLNMIQRRADLTARGGHAVCLGILACAMVWGGVMAAGGCSSLPGNTALPSLEEDIVITTGGDGKVGQNFASYPVMVENKGGILSVADIRLQAELLDVTGGGETLLASQEIDAGSYEPGEVRTMDVVFRLIKLTGGKDVHIRVTRME